MGLTLEQIQTKSKELEPLDSDDALLFQKLNLLSIDNVKVALDSYKRDYFKPVNLLRSEIAQKLINKEKVSEATVENIKEKNN